MKILGELPEANEGCQVIFLAKKKQLSFCDDGLGPMTVSIKEDLQY